MKILGIETSCDETSTAVYDTERGLLSHCVYSQIKTHAPFGGVVPELASRDHIRKTLPLVEQALKEASISLKEVEGVAYTKGPGLVGALMVGASIGRALGYAWNVPALGVHHMEAHLMAVMLDKRKPTFPFITLLVSGGHTLLIEVKGLGQYFPRPMTDRPGLNFSFSGIKTFAVNCVRENADDEQTKADIAYAFEEAVVDTLFIKVKRALKQTGLNQVVMAGGVSANKRLRQTLKEKLVGAEVFYPQFEFCTDNAAMVAYLGAMRLSRGEEDDLKIEVKPRWSIEEIGEG